MAVGAGPSVSAEIQRLWNAERPDEAFFLNAAAAATAEQLLLRARKSICDWAEPTGLAALSQESPGYDGWDLGDQFALLDLLAAQPAWPSAASSAVLTRPSLSQGVQATISRHPATLARVTVISVVEANGAVPPGM